METSKSSVDDCRTETPLMQEEDFDHDSDCPPSVVTQDDPRLEMEGRPRLWDPEAEERIWSEQVEEEKKHVAYHEHVWRQESFAQVPTHALELELHLQLQWGIQKLRAQCLGEELASRLTVRDHPDFFSPWSKTTSLDDQHS